MTAQTILDLATALGVRLWVDWEDGEETLRYLGPDAAVPALASALLLNHAALVELLRGRQPGEPERTAAAPWACPCCERFFGEDEVGIEGWCRFCLAVVADECARLDEADEAVRQQGLQALAGEYAQLLVFGG